jgi:hypothetical protein
MESLDLAGVSGGRVESRPEMVGGGCKVAIHGLDPGIPAGMTAEWVLHDVLIIPAGTIPT